MQVRGGRPLACRAHRRLGQADLLWTAGRQCGEGSDQDKAGCGRHSFSRVLLEYFLIGRGGQVPDAMYAARM